MGNDVWIGFTEFSDEEEGVGLEVGVVLPVFSFGVLAGIIGAESDDGDVGFEGEGFLEMVCFDKGAVGFAKEAKGGGGEGFDFMGVSQKVAESG